MIELVEAEAIPVLAYLSRRITFLGLLKAPLSDIAIIKVSRRETAHAAAVYANAVSQGIGILLPFWTRKPAQPRLLRDWSLAQIRGEFMLISRQGWDREAIDISDPQC
jgi:hypothetical protein